MNLRPPRDKHDLEAAHRAARASWDQMEPLAMQLLEWVQDPNWPVAKILVPALANVGAPLAPGIRQVLAGHDDTWKYNLIDSIVARSPDLGRLLRPELERIAFQPTPSEQAEEVDRVARAALEK